MTVQTALQQASKLLEDAAVPAPRLTAEVLLCHALRRERSYLYGHPEAELTHPELLDLARYLRRRIGGAPTQYITGVQEFYGRPFRVTPDVLIPRPETEHVVETALDFLKSAPGGCPPRAADVGCGSGAIAATLALESHAEVWATDISHAALRVAQANAEALGAKVRFVACDVLDAFGAASLDLVVSNPPYVGFGEAAGLQREVRDFEPRVALFAGPTGFEIYERLVDGARRVLRPGGRLVVELGFKSEAAVRAMLGTGWDEVRANADLAGIPRVLAARLA